MIIIKTAHQKILSAFIVGLTLLHFRMGINLRHNGFNKPIKISQNLNISF
ncbi:Uncharacterised protein [Mycobacteroides abscessus subsp. abscessus]|nr:Uncharacterised protein [Mycobacteroides abscessus subsp. abscessus]